jgi:hypothetical protein
MLGDFSGWSRTVVQQFVADPHKNPSSFSSSVFCDFGADFIVLDATGEQPVSGMVVSIENVRRGYVSFYSSWMVESDSAA